MRWDNLVRANLSFELREVGALCSVHSAGLAPLEALIGLSNSKFNYLFIMKSRGTSQLLLRNQSHLAK